MNIMGKLTELTLFQICIFWRLTIGFVIRFPVVDLHPTDSWRSAQIDPQERCAVNEDWVLSM